MTDMYYSIGTVQIKNVTDGWSITADSPRTKSVTFGWRTAFDSITTMAYTVGRTFYDNDTKDETDKVWARASMQSDNWGPVPFVVMAPENFSPNDPDGEHFEHMLDGHFVTLETDHEEDVYLGVIGKDGAYTPPNDGQS